jgi:hypothetical protein
MRHGAKWHIERENLYIQTEVFSIDARNENVDCCEAKGLGVLKSDSLEIEIFNTHHVN